MRYENEVRTLWLDQLSINQNDLEERGRQVAVMFDIYKRSRRVVIWLGKEESFSRRAMEAIEVLNKWKDLGTNDWDQLMRLMEETKGFGNDYAPDIANLLQSPWFQRVWTIQEGIASIGHGVVMHGSSTVDVDQLWGLSRPTPKQQTVLAEVDRMFYDKYPRPRWPIDHLKIISKLHVLSVARMDSSFSFSAVLARVRGCSAIDARDFVYSIYQLLPAQMRRALGDPNYSQPVEELFEQVAAIDIENGYANLCLKYAGKLQQSLELPSWVPDWTFNAILDPKKFVGLKLAQHDSWRIPWSSAAIFRLSNRMRNLEVTANLLGKITIVSTEPYDDLTNFVTSEGLTGHASSGILLTDILAVFHGCDEPFVILAAEDKYILIAECWVQGLEDGRGRESFNMDTAQIITLI